MHKKTSFFSSRRAALPPLLTAALLLAAAAQRHPALQQGPAPGPWDTLFGGGSLDAWRGVREERFPAEAWEVRQGTLSVKDHIGGRDIMTRKTYGNFELAFEFKLTPRANSGIKYLVNRIPNLRSGSMDWNGPEYQIIDDYQHPEVKEHPQGVGSTAAFYLLYAPVGKTLHEAGRWNRGRIIVRGAHIEHWLNGVRVVNCERGTPDYRRRVAATKFSDYGVYGEEPRGRIMLTDHGGDKVYYRNITIRSLP